MEASKITDASLNGDELGDKIIDLFLEIYGTEVGDAALKLFPYGGIFLCGGVTEKLRKHFETRKHFMNAFHDKGRVSKMIEQFPVMLVVNDLGLKGAEVYAIRYLCD